MAHSAECCTIRGRMTVDCDARGSMRIDADPRGSLSVGTVVFRDGTNDYSELVNKPSIDGVVLEGDKTLEDLGDSPLTNLEIQAIFDMVFN